jgi:hypothetical protein
LDVKKETQPQDMTGGDAGQDDPTPGKVTPAPAAAKPAMKSTKKDD